MNGGVLAAAILASGGLPAKRRLPGSATRCPRTWAGDVLDQLTSVLRGRGGEAARMPKVIPACLIPAYTKRTEFRPGLESVRRGWHPNYPPLLFFRTGAGGQCQWGRDLVRVQASLVCQGRSKPVVSRCSEGCRRNTGASLTAGIQKKIRRTPSSSPKELFPRHSKRPSS
jgi:hypothetical protein